MKMYLLTFLVYALLNLILANLYFKIDPQAVVWYIQIGTKKINQLSILKRRACPDNP